MRDAKPSGSAPKVSVVAAHQRASPRCCEPCRGTCRGSRRFNVLQTPPTIPTARRIRHPDQRAWKRVAWRAERCRFQTEIASVRSSASTHLAGVLTARWRRASARRTSRSRRAPIRMICWFFIIRRVRSRIRVATRKVTRHFSPCPPRGNHNDRSRSGLSADTRREPHGSSFGTCSKTNTMPGDVCGRCRRRSRWGTSG